MFSKKDYMESIINRPDFSKLMEDCRSFDKLPREEQFKKMGRKPQSKQQKNETLTMQALQMK